MVTMTELKNYIRDVARSSDVPIDQIESLEITISFNGEDLREFLRSDLRDMDILGCGGTYEDEEGIIHSYITLG